MLFDSILPTEEHLSKLELILSQAAAALLTKFMQQCSHLHYYLSQIFWINCNIYISTCCFICTFMLWRWLLSNLMNQPLLASNVSSAASSPLSTFIELRTGTFSYKECCGWFSLLSRPLKLCPCQRKGCFGFLSFVCSLEQHF